MSSLLDDFLRRHRMTEVSNLSGHLDDQTRLEFFEHWSQIVDWVPHDERYVESEQAQHAPIFTRVGLTDAALSVLAEGGTAVLTDDFDLYDHLSRRGLDVLNFSHLRPLAWRP